MTVQRINIQVFSEAHNCFSGYHIEFMALFSYIFIKFSNFQNYINCIQYIDMKMHTVYETKQKQNKIKQ